MTSDNGCERNVRAKLVRVRFDVHRDPSSLYPGEYHRIADLLRAGVRTRDVASQLKVATAMVWAVKAELLHGSNGGTP